MYCLLIYTGPPAPSGVMVDGVDDTSVRVSWGTVSGADRYTVIFTKTKGGDQEGLCLPATHLATVSVDAPSTSASIGVGQMLAGDDTTLLRAYTTYSITVVAESDVAGSSEDSEPVTVTTAQTSKCQLLAIHDCWTYYFYRCYSSSSQCHSYSCELHCHLCPVGWPGSL